MVLLLQNYLLFSNGNKAFDTSIGDDKYISNWCDVYGKQCRFMVRENISVYMEIYWIHKLKDDVPLDTKQGKQNIMYVNLAAGCFHY